MGPVDEATVTTLSNNASPPPSQPSLLPAFEPSSSPSLPRPQKRKFDASPLARTRDVKQYPTPAATSSTGIIPSSPSQLPGTRPALLRSTSGVSERVPLGSVPTVKVPLDGQAVLMGRSSNSSHYQLSANRLISRVHVRAYYEVPSDQHEHGQIIMECLGWNGAKIHCRGRAFQLGKGDTFSSDRPQADIMLDVQDARVMIRWPQLERKDSPGAFSDATWDDESSPVRIGALAPDGLPSSPPQVFAHLQSPISPSPRQRLDPTASTTFIGLRSSASPTKPSVEVYEDESSAEEQLPLTIDEAIPLEPAPKKIHLEASCVKSLQSSPALDAESFSDHNEENDPIVHSFGPFGDNILPRMATFHAVSPERADRPARQPLRASISPSQSHKQKNELGVSTKRESSPVKNHVINQLAFSRLHSLPLSTILNNLPAELKSSTSTVTATSAGTEGAKLTEEELKQLLDNTPCVGEIQREGKDAAGKPLEDEFYYIPQLDTDEMRRSAIEGSLGKPGLRAVRKQHKQYYWKRPRN